MWRKCKMIDRFGTFFIEEMDESMKWHTPIPIQCYMIHRKKKISDFEDIFNVIGQEMIKYIRERKINKLLYENYETNNTAKKGSSKNH